MKGSWCQRICPLTALLIAISSIAFNSSQGSQAKPSQNAEESIQFFPHTFDKYPELPSPCTLEDGTEIVIAFTTEKKFTLIPVTAKKGESLGYRDNDWDKIRMLEVNAEDFPTLARTGLHSEIELDHTRRITGRSIAEITDAGRPEGSSGAGFMGAEEDIISVLKGDNRIVKKLGLTHPQLAKPLFHIWNIIRWVSYKSRNAGHTISGVDCFFYNNRKVQLISGGGRGWQNSIFNDEILGMYHIEFSSELDEEEKTFIKNKYPNLDIEQKTDLLKKLTYIHTGEMVPFYSMRYGFYEGHTDYRADPIAISFIFGLKSLNDIDKAFEGNLYRILTEPFTRETISSEGGEI